MTPDAYKLDELAQLSGVAARTVRYYVQRGLLPAPAFRGKDTAYGAEHLLRLHAIRRLQEHHLPLEVIQQRLAGLSISELESVSGSSAEPPRAPDAVTTREVAQPIAFATTWTIAPGLSLHLSEDAPTRSRVLADRLLAFLNATKETL